jgi:hypothetical protein
MAKRNQYKDVLNAQILNICDETLEAIVELDTTQAIAFIERINELSKNPAIHKGPVKELSKNLHELLTEAIKQQHHLPEQ